MSLLSQKIKADLIAAAPKGKKGAVKKMFTSIEKIQAKVDSMEITPSQRESLEKLLAALVDALIKIVMGLVAGMPK